MIGAICIKPVSPVRRVAATVSSVKTQRELKSFKPRWNKFEIPAFCRDRSRFPHGTARWGACVMQKRPDPPGRTSKKGKEIPVRDQSPKDHGPEIDSELQAHIGRHLKASYEDILGQDVPDRFVELLAKLEAKQKDPDGSKGGTR
jgi:hypothetical protein